MTNHYDLSRQQERRSTTGNRTRAGDETSIHKNKCRNGSVDSKSCIHGTLQKSAENPVDVLSRSSRFDKFGSKRTKVAEAIEEPMKEITVYQSNDGSRWDDPEKAKERDALYSFCRGIELVLPVVRDLGPNEFYQHKGGDVRAFDAAWQEFAQRTYGTIKGRVLDDIGGPVRELMYRSMRIDIRNREWQQPYFTTNPPDDAVCINK